MLQLAAHHTGTCLYLLEPDHAFTQFRERNIGLLLDLGTDEFGATLECPVRTVDWGVCGDLSSRTLPIQPFLDSRQADSESRSYGSLCLVTDFGGDKDTLAEVWTIWIHARKSNPF